MEPLQFQLVIPPELKAGLLAELKESLKPIYEAIGRLEEKIDQGKVVKREMNVNQLAEFLNVKPKWIYRKTNLKNHPIPHTSNGKYLTFKIKDVLEWRDRMNGRY
jgi:hypothetical protein